MPLSEKYVVVKAEDWYDHLSRDEVSSVEAERLEALRIGGEFFVVRQDDVYAPSGLFAYAANVRTSVEVIKFLGLSLMTRDMQDHLLDFADSLTETALHWQRDHETRKRPPRIPD